MAKLICLRGPRAGKTIKLDRDCVLGRAFDCDLYLSDLNVSRQHARIKKQPDGRFVLEDLGSGNGTLVNQQPISSKLLEPQDLIEIGGSTFRYETGETKKKWPTAVMTVISSAKDEINGIKNATEAELKFAKQKATAETGEKRFAHLTEQRARKMLDVMYDTGDVIAAELHLETLLEKILNHLFEIFPQVERGFVLFIDEKTGQIYPEALKQRQPEKVKGFIYSQSMFEQVLEHGEGIIRESDEESATTIEEKSTFFEEDVETFNQNAQAKDSSVITENSGVSSTSKEPKMAAPLICQGKIIGTIHLEATPTSPQFTQEDLHLLSAVARQAALVIANARAGQALLARQRLEDDLRLARQIQHCFLPQRLPSITNVDFSSHYLPALEVGGDFYDVFVLDDSHLGILIGDVAGKGISAALMMAKIVTDLRILVRQCLSPAELMSRANISLIESGQDVMFATALYLILDLNKNSVTLSNAGHQPPLAVSSQWEGISEFDAGANVALGIVPHYKYQETTYSIGPGDVVLLYTDGINEAMNREGRDYGMDRLQRLILQVPPEPDLLIKRLVADVQHFTGNSAQSDDLTLLAFSLRAKRK